MVVWLPKERVLFAGDTVEFGAAPYRGDGHFAGWPATLRAIRDFGPERSWWTGGRTGRYGA